MAIFLLASYPKNRSFKNTEFIKKKQRMKKPSAQQAKALQKVRKSMEKKTCSL